MKYGLIYYHNTTNLGDDILSYAGKRFLPRVDYYIDREKMDMFVPNERESVTAILNGWYMHSSYAFPPSPYILPLFIGTHFNCDTMILGDYSYLDGCVTTYLKENGPVGCRDKQTMQVLVERGIDSYFSGCLTLTLQKYVDVLPSDNIILTDVSDEVEQYVRKVLPNKNIICLTHNLLQEDVGWGNWQRREQRVESYLKIYQGASLVITTRLHCALPCIALDTPVLFVGKYDEDYYDRIESFAQYFACFSERQVFAGEADKILLNPSKNNDVGGLVRQMEIKCRTFIESAEHIKENSRNLPELNLYKKLYIERIACMRNSIDKLLNIKYQLEVQHLQDIDTMNRVMEMAKKLIGGADK